MEKIALAFQKFAVTLGIFPNSIIKFLSVGFGDNSGKLLSLSVVIFGIYIMWTGFFGQVRTVSHLVTIENPTTEQSEEIRKAYNEAMASVSTPLGVLVGAIPVIVGIGLINKRNNSSNEDNVV